jgi:hypothetical protein
MLLVQSTAPRRSNARLVRRHTTPHPLHRIYQPKDPVLDH